MAREANRAARKKAARRGDGPQLGVLDNVLVFRLRRIRDVLAGEFRRSSTEGRGLRAGDLTALALIDANPGISQAELARTGGFDQTVLVGILDDLENRGWAVRSRDRTDRRRHRVEVTNKGRTALADLLRRAEANEAIARNALTRKELTAFRAALGKIYAALAKE
jgi:DNA-binding MarR family transcriptional regulator